MVTTNTTTITDVTTIVPASTSTSTTTATATITSTNPADDYRGAGFATFVETVNGVNIYEVEVIVTEEIIVENPEQSLLNNKKFKQLVKFLLLKQS